MLNRFLKALELIDCPKYRELRSKCKSSREIGFVHDKGILAIERTARDDAVCVRGTPWGQGTEGQPSSTQEVCFPKPVMPMHIWSHMFLHHGMATPSRDRNLCSPP